MTEEKMTEDRAQEMQFTNHDKEIHKEITDHINIKPVIVPSISMESLKSSPSTEELNPMGINNILFPPVPLENSKIILPSTRRKFKFRQILRRREKLRKEKREVKTKDHPKLSKEFKVCFPVHCKKQILSTVLYNEMTPEDQNRVRSLIIDLGYALSVYGVPAHRIEEHLTRVSDYYGLYGSYIYTPNAIWFSFGSDPSEMSTSYHLVRIKSTTIDLCKLCLIDDLAYAISKGKFTIKEAQKKLQEIVSTNTNFSNPFVEIISYSLSALSMAIGLDGTWAELVAASIGGLIVGLLAFGSKKFQIISKLFTIVSALICGLVAIIFRVICSKIVRVSVFLVSLSGFISLVPGLVLTLSMAEMATNNILSGSARIMRAFLTALQLGFGVAIAYKIGNFFPIQDIPTNWKSPEWLNVIASIIGTTGYIIRLRAPLYLFAIFLMYTATYGGNIATRYATQYFGSELGPMVGAIVIGIAGNIYGKVSKHPGIVITAVGILVLVPGSISVRSMNAMIENDAISGIFFLFRMFMIGLSLVIGLFISHFIIPNKRLNL